MLATLMIIAAMLARIAIADTTYAVRRFSMNGYEAF
jgi:hypothetical protein